MILNNKNSNIFFFSMQRLNYFILKKKEKYIQEVSTPESAFEVCNSLSHYNQKSQFHWGCCLLQKIVSQAENHKPEDSLHDKTVWILENSRMKERCLLKGASATELSRPGPNRQTLPQPKSWPTERDHAVYTTSERDHACWPALNYTMPLSKLNSHRNWTGNQPEKRHTSKKEQGTAYYLSFSELGKLNASRGSHEISIPTGTSSNFMPGGSRGYRVLV